MWSSLTILKHILKVQQVLGPICTFLFMLSPVTIRMNVLPLPVPVICTSLHQTKTAWTRAIILLFFPPFVKNISTKCLNSLPLLSCWFCNYYYHLIYDVVMTWRHKCCYSVIGLWRSHWQLDFGVLHIRYIWVSTIFWLYGYII